MQSAKPKIDPANPQHALYLREMIRILASIDFASGERDLQIIAERFKDDDNAERKAKVLDTISEMFAMMKDTHRLNDEALAHLLDVTMRPQHSTRKRQN